MKGTSMKTNREIRLSSLKRVLTGKWFARILFVMMVLGTVNNLVNKILGEVYKSCEIQTWFDFAVAKIAALSEGLEYAVPSRAVATQMNHSTAFALFIAFIFGGIALFGVTSVMLKAARDEERNWLGDAFSGFARPLGLAWLGFVVAVRVVLWSLLLVVPGIVAGYRYSQCWNLKVENPDWSAIKCITESTAMMEGHKAQRFRLDMFFLIIMFVAVAFSLLLTAVGRALSLAVIDGFIVPLFMAVFSILVGMWMSVARALFYSALKESSSAL